MEKTKTHVPNHQPVVKSTFSTMFDGEIIVLEPQQAELPGRPFT
jgi:hypothetical protein